MRDIMKVPQKKLKLINIFTQIIYVGLSFIAPITTTIIMCYSNSYIHEGWKMPIIMIIILACIISASAHYLNDTIKKINILKIDGTYNVPAQTTKHILQAIGSSVMPLAVLLLTTFFQTYLQDALIFYTRMIIIISGFYVGGNVWRYTVCERITEELDIRAQVAMDNAKKLRSNIK